MKNEMRFCARNKSTSPRHYKTISFLFALFLLRLWLSGIALGGAPSLMDQPTLIIDQANSGSALIILWNPTSQTIPRGVLTAGDFVSATTKLQIGARFAFSTPGSQSSAPVLNIDEIQPKTKLYVKVDVGNLWQAGESSADLEYNGNKIGSLKAIKYPVPFAVSVQSITPDNAMITFQRGQPGSLAFKNDDAVYYPVHWELTIAGKKVSGPDLVVPPKGSRAVEFNSPPSWFTWYRGIFKEDLQDGLLSLSFAAQDSQLGASFQTKSIPIKVRLLYWTPLCQQIIGMFIIFVVLFLGGGCSLAVSYWVPNRLRQGNFNEQIDQLAVKIRELSSEHIDSRLRVLVRVQRQRLRQLLFSRWLLSPDLAGVFSQCEKGIATLNKQVALLKNIDVRFDQLKKSAKDAMPPTLLNKIEKKLKKAQDRLNDLEPTESDFQAAQDAISEAEKQTATLAQEDSAFAQELAARVAGLIGYFNGLPGKKEECRIFREKLSSAFTYLDAQYTDTKNISLSYYYQLDMNTAKLEVIREYLDCPGSSSSDHSLRDKLVEYLKQDGWQQLRASQQLVQQVREEILEGNILEEIKMKPPHVAMDPGVARPYLPVRFSARFDRRNLNESAARDQFICEWDFGHDGLKETGWEVSHYFPKELKGGYTVNARFISPNGEPVKNSVENEVEVKKSVIVQADPTAMPYSLLKTELFYLSIVLFAALLALIGGAREQLAKMDLIPGLIGVFILGFSSDQIKNLLTQRTPGAERK